MMKIASTLILAIICSFTTFKTCFSMSAMAHKALIYDQIESCYFYLKVLGSDDETPLIELYKHSLNQRNTLSQGTRIILTSWGINPNHPLTREIVRKTLKTTHNFNLVTIERPFNDQTDRLVGKSNHKNNN